MFFNFHRDHTVHVEDLKYRAVFAEGTWRLEAHKLSVHAVGADFLQKPRSPDFTWTLVSVSDNQLKLKDAGSDIVRVHQRVR